METRYYLYSFSGTKNHINNTFSSLHNRLIKDTPENHPIIIDQNSEAGLHAKTYQGRNVDTKEYPPGYINPINIKTTKKNDKITCKNTIKKREMRNH